MSNGRFDRRIPLPSRGQITVKGPFDPEDARVDNAKIFFLIVQGEGGNAVVVNGEGEWSRSKGNKWSGKAGRRGKRVGGQGTGPLHQGLARGIALSIVTKPGETFDDGRKFDPPTIETLTWCADFEFSRARGPSRRVTPTS